MLVIATQNFPPHPGGIENLMHSLAAALSRSGEEVTVFADRQASSSLKDFDQAQPFPVFRYSGLKPLRRRRKARDILEFCRNHAHGSSLHLIADSWKSLEFIDTGPFSGVLCLAHGTELPHRSASGKRDRITRSFAKATHVIPNSHFTAGLARPYMQAPDKIHVIYPGIDSPGLEDEQVREVSRRIGPGKPVLITVARLEERKGHMAVIKTLPSLIAEFPSLLYVIVGEGPEKRALQKASARLALEQHVLFAGRLTGTDKNAWLANSDLFVMPGSVIGRDVEGFGMAYLEAACLGVPAVACDAGGAPEAVLHERTGLVCEPGRPDQLERAILCLLRDGKYRKDLGDQARERSKDFLWTNRVKDYRDILSG